MKIGHLNSRAIRHTSNTERVAGRQVAQFAPGCNWIYKIFGL